MIPVPEFWQAVARGIDAEEQKASIFITHNLSRGIAREAILRNVLVSHTPGPFNIATGFIYDIGTNVAGGRTRDPWLSKQCDVLVYNPQVARPYYAIANLVVVPRHSAKFVIEVKTSLDGAALQEILDICQSTLWLPVPTFGFAYEGIAFETFLQHLKSSILSSQSGVPECIAVHRQNYVVLRSTYRLVPASEKRHRSAKYQLAVDFGTARGCEGSSTAVFLDSYQRWLTGLDTEAYLPYWFNSLQLPHDKMVRFDDDGTIHYGPIPGV